MLVDSVRKKEYKQRQMLLPDFYRSLGWHRSFLLKNHK